MGLEQWIREVVFCPALHFIQPKGGYYIGALLPCPNGRHWLQAVGLLIPSEEPIGKVLCRRVCGGYGSFFYSYILRRWNMKLCIAKSHCACRLPVVCLSFFFVHLVKVPFFNDN